MKKTMLALFFLTAMSASFAQAYDSQYDCHPSKSNAWLTHGLVLDTDEGSIDLDGHSLSLDPTYRPRNMKNYSRYVGDTRFLEKQTLLYAPIEVLVGERVTPIKRFMTIRIHEDGGYQDEKFVCIDVQAGT